VSGRLISIIGPIAAGKTTLARQLAADLNADVLFEDYAGNPFLAENSFRGEKYSFPSQIYFLMSRTGQLFEAGWPDEGFVVSDYGFCQDRIYARIMLKDEDLALYMKLSARMELLVRQPDIIIHLDAAPEVLESRIGRRGRKFELSMSRKFIEELREAHFGIEVPEGCRLLKASSEELAPGTPGYTELLKETRKLI
jgi:deoxyadenosine/deoxycytidine kinase